MLKNVEFAFCSLIEPTNKYQSEDLEFTVTLIIPGDRTSDIKKLGELIEELHAQGKEEQPKKAKQRRGKAAGNDDDWHNPLRECVEIDALAESNPDAWFIKAYTNFNPSFPNNGRPPIVDAKKRPITKASDCYSGCFGNVFIELCYFSPGNSGVSAYVKAVQVTYKGDMQGMVNPDAVFDEEEGFAVGEDDDYDNSDDALWPENEAEFTTVTPAEIDSVKSKVA